MGSPQQLRLFQIENHLSARLGADFFRSLPSVPGVYFFFGADGALLYIGQSLDLKARIGSYRHVTPEKNPKRTLKLVHRVFKIEWRECAAAAEAIELERVLLLEHRPPFNRAGVWKGDPWWLKIEAVSDRLNLELVREESGIGPLPPSFRYLLSSLIRCLFRLSSPSVALADYPHGLFEPTLPPSLSIGLPNAAEASGMLAAYAGGRFESLRTKLDEIHLGVSASEQEYWKEEVARLVKYAAKTQKADSASKAVEVNLC